MVCEYPESVLSGDDEDARAQQKVDWVFKNIHLVLAMIRADAESSGASSGVIDCPLCKTGALHYSRSGNSVNFDGRCANPHCGFAWRY
jgi:hypothetical protein